MPKFINKNIKDRFCKNVEGLKEAAVRYFAQARKGRVFQTREKATRFEQERREDEKKRREK